MPRRVRKVAAADGGEAPGKSTRKRRRRQRGDQRKKSEGETEPRLKKILEVNNARNNTLRLAPTGMKTNRKANCRSCADNEKKNKRPARRNASETGEKKKMKRIRQAPHIISQDYLSYFKLRIARSRFDSCSMNSRTRPWIWSRTRR